MIQCVWLDYKNTGLILSPTQQLRQLFKSNSNILDGKLQARLPWKPFAWYSTSTWYLAIVACFFEDQEIKLAHRKMHEPIAQSVWKDFEVKNECLVNPLNRLLKWSVLLPGNAIMDKHGPTKLNEKSYWMLVLLKFNFSMNWLKLDNHVGLTCDATDHLSQPKPNIYVHYLMCAIRLQIPNCLARKIMSM